MAPATLAPHPRDHALVTFGKLIEEAVANEAGKRAEVERLIIEGQDTRRAQCRLTLALARTSRLRGGRAILLSEGKEK